MKINKKILQIGILILIVLLVGAYFLNEFYFSKKDSNELKLEKVSLEEVFEFKVVRDDLTQESIDKYKKDFDQAVSDTLQQDDKFSLTAINRIGNIKRILHDYDGARKAWEYACAGSPKNSIAYFNLGLLYAEDLKDNLKAEIAFLKALENSAGETANEQYYRGIYDFYMYNYPEQKDKIEDILKQGLETIQYKDNLSLLSLLATYYGETGNKTEALKYWNKMLEIDPTNEAVKGEIERLK